MLTEQKSKVITWTRDMFPEGSVGHAIFPDKLEGRIRNSRFLGRDRDFALHRRVRRWAQVDKAGIATIGDLLNFPTARLPEVVKVSQIPPLIDSLREKMASDVLLRHPEQSLMCAIFGWPPQDRIRQVSLEGEKARHEAIQSVLQTLTDRERRVVTLRFGLQDGESRTLEGTAQELSLTRERVRQIELKALRKLRHPAKSMKLRDFSPWEPRAET